MNKHELHPLCTLFPRMPDAEFAALCADIKGNGLREPITLHDSMILDGGNRYRACLEVGIEPKFIEYSGENIVGYVLSANLHRRHLTPGQHAAIVASCADWEKSAGRGGDRGNQHTGGKVQRCTLATSEDRSAQSGASERTQKTADKVAKADPELAKAVGRGEITLPQAAKMVEKKQAKDKPDQSPEPEYTTEDALRDQVAELQDQLAVSGLSGAEKHDAEDLIKSLRENVKALEIERDAIKSSRDFFQSENSELKKQVAYWRKQAEKA